MRHKLPIRRCNANQLERKGFQRLLQAICDDEIRERHRIIIAEAELIWRNLKYYKEQPKDWN